MAVTRPEVTALEVRTIALALLCIETSFDFADAGFLRLIATMQVLCVARNPLRDPLLVMVALFLAFVRPRPAAQPPPTACASPGFLGASQRL